MYSTWSAEQLPATPSGFSYGNTFPNATASATATATANAKPISSALGPTPGAFVDPRSLGTKRDPARDLVGQIASRQREIEKLYLDQQRELEEQRKEIEVLRNRCSRVLEMLEEKTQLETDLLQQIKKRDEKIERLRRAHRKR